MARSSGDGGSAEIARVTARSASFAWCTGGGMRRATPRPYGRTAEATRHHARRPTVHAPRLTRASGRATHNMIDTPNGGTPDGMAEPIVHRLIMVATSAWRWPPHHETCNLHAETLGLLLAPDAPGRAWFCCAEPEQRHLGRRAADVAADAARGSALDPRTWYELDTAPAARQRLTETCARRASSCCGRRTPSAPPASTRSATGCCWTASGSSRSWARTGPRTSRACRSTSGSTSGSGGASRS
ncbi:hypothetical protein BJF78_19225 [Pseudonocardia sp. CNS-139]|nr:hypothetical protein BJF78_19225 [Pseudonocardia sp. CNS-139]